MNNPFPLLGVHLVLWDNYEDYLSSLSWWDKKISHWLGYDLKQPGGAYNRKTRTVHLFLRPISQKALDWISNLSYQKRYEKIFLDTLLHELMHASDIEVVQGSHQIEPEKLEALPEVLRDLFEPEDWK